MPASASRASQSASGWYVRASVSGKDSKPREHVVRTKLEVCGKARGASGSHNAPRVLLGDAEHSSSAVCGREVRRTSTRPGRSTSLSISALLEEAQRILGERISQISLLKWNDGRNCVR